MFPPKKTPFSLIINGEKFTVELDKSSRIWAGGFSDKIRWNLGAIIEITKDAEGIYILEQKE